MRSRLLAATVLLLLSACGGTPEPRFVPAQAGPPASVWPSAFGDAGHTSPTTVAGPTTGALRWTRMLEGAVTPGAVIGRDGSVLAAGNGGVLHALDPATGQDRWTFDGVGSYGNDLSTSPAVLPDGTILWPGPGQQLFALRQDGKFLWSEPFDGFVLSPAVVGTRAYVADMGGTLVAFDVGAGGEHRRVWAKDFGGTSYSSPAVGPEGNVYVAHDRTVVAVRDEGTSARVAWEFQTKDLIEVSIAAGADGTVVVGTNDDDTYGLAADGTVRWRYDRGDWTYSSAVVTRDRAYFGDHLGYLDVVDLATGARVRRDLGIPSAQGRSSVGTGVWTAPLVDVDGRTYFGTAAGHVYGFDDSGSPLFDVDVGGVVASYPALTADGTLLIGSTNGTLYAFGD